MSPPAFSSSPGPRWWAGPAAWPPTCRRRSWPTTRSAGESTPARTPGIVASFSFLLHSETALARRRDSLATTLSSNDNEPDRHTAWIFFGFEDDEPRGLGCLRRMALAR